MSGPFVVGLTGSIGMGKTTTADIFQSLGVPVWDADKTVHELYSANGKGVLVIQKIAPDAVKNDQVDREILRNWVHENPESLALIEKGIHPLVAQHRQKFLSETTEPIVVLDIPLLFEISADKDCDLVVVVSVDEATQRRRVLSRPNMTEEAFDYIRSKQIKNDEKVKKADRVIITDTLEHARQQVKELLKEIMAGLNNA